MRQIDLINSFGKIFIISIYVYFVYIKISNYKGNNLYKTILIFFSSIIISIIYSILVLYVNPIFIIPVLFCVFGIFIKLVLKQKFYYCMFLVIISFSLTYLIYLISVLIAGVSLIVFKSNIDYNSSVVIIIIFTIMLIIYQLLNKIRRFKNGLNFLKNIENINKFGKFINVVFMISIILFSILHKSQNFILNYLLAWITIIMVAIIIYWIQTQITKTYKSNMRDRTIEIQKNEIDEKDKIIEELKSENFKLATTIHKYNHKFSSLESAMKNAIGIDNKTEFANELSVILKETEDTIEKFSKEVSVNKNKLPLTNIPGIDNMFKYMQEEAIKNNIHFDLKINESINYLVENIIPKEKFEILIGDHLKDAIIAINASNNSYKSILVTLGLVENCYELNIYDTGIEFKIDTLLKLGKKQVTTHKETGGSGIGFMTTFETLKNCKASLIIEEYKSETTNYTKAVIIRFDNKNEYKIISYRAEEIKKLKNGRKIIIQNID